MHNPTIYRAQFSGLILNVMGADQVVACRPEIEMFQVRDSPQLWRARPDYKTGKRPWEASSPRDLACILEEAFVSRLTTWESVISSGPRLPRPRPQNVVSIDQRKRA